MNKRSFLKSLATIAIAPSILIPRAPDAYRFVRCGGPVEMIPGGEMIVINPEWEKAPYELVFSGREIWVEDRSRCHLYGRASYGALRYVKNEAGIFELVHQFKTIRTA